jgi:two-component system chemotaxis response regulator CheY
MRILVAEDDLASRRFLSKFLSSYGECDLTVDGMEALDAFLIGLDEDNTYDLICLDVMMPKIDGIQALKAIRDIEKQRGIEVSKHVKVIMTTALDDTEVMFNSTASGNEAYLAKPIDTDKLVEIMKKLKLIE